MHGRRVLLHCNAGAEFGMGHLMRTVSIAREAQSRGWSVAIVGDIDDAGAAVAGRMTDGIEIVASRGPRLANELGSLARGADVVHLDSYWDVPPVAPRSGGIVSNMQDGPYGVRDTDLAIDANLGSESSFAHPERSLHHLIGIDLAVVREQVLRQRSMPPVRGSRPRVLVVMGGTDPHGLTARVIRAMHRIPEELQVTVIDPRARAEVLAEAAASPHAVEVRGFVDDLPALARLHDLAVTAAGTSVWDFACMGVPMALVCAVDNQRAGYREVVSRGLAVALGEPPHDDLAERVGTLAAILSSGAALDTRAEQLMRAVDGRGTWRIVSAWEQLLDVVPADAPHVGALAVRTATPDDASLLFEWRNDPATRLNSRAQGALDWDSHRDWVARSIADVDRSLLIVESGGTALATCRWDRRSESDWEVSITVAPSARGRGLAASVLASAESALPARAPCRMLAVVHADNAPSLRLFQKAGYLPHLPPDETGFATFAKWRLPSER
ncbi:bifunctional UDP-2,4-diacetamido-2,4,6-trideoxy-beta-L-altropyranose hydrolase/GNAT family N-acetyltransferase [Microbacterium sp. Leaf159]|uniref:bifunctional UDP-2,4-diacetamido-2,4,6-trideoxy-beta-L-altropyranose hydrolase/GNAT family N-acetyltransferase n=1 Tax=Microbacterium sp. Leaf159 TaxID=1736279 RepID=UPI0006F82BEA|nr:bifunctional UDP-2,4-diacetamido-2,4,6-trideoxy-beta-L-altropyranose hydrolase/GNAT family N-acetyltransferase [Microbacterium sp. Leaf159]KQR38824.1 hypothetical protein ASF80_04955 [Microbacterium sp. Leaf159]